MKTTILISLLHLLVSLNMFATAFTFKDEDPVNDIPFDTKAVFDNVMDERAVASLAFEEESYVNDIPFDTEKISQQVLYQKAIAVEFHFEEEEQVEDLPFNTQPFGKNERTENENGDFVLNSI